MHILVTNDDGVTAPGLLSLVQALRKIGKVSVIAPDHNWSASGHVKTLHRPLRVKDVRLADDSEACASDGAPSDCVALAVLGLVKDIDFIVSGINPNANLGHDMTYSGTVTAAMEGAIWGIPSMAISLDSPDGFNEKLDYDACAEVARQVVQAAYEHGIPPNTLLNVNVPYLPITEIKGFKITRQGLRIYRDELIQRKDPRGKPYYWIGGDFPTGVNEDGTDFGALSEGYVSITPVQLDLTAHALLEQIRDWNMKLED
ncbi:MAG: 5'/3'-nucleotidase SurE [Anaerolineaceae bacterium]